MDESELIPCLPHEIAMTCLVGLPRRNRAIASCVSGALSNALKNNSSIKSVCASLNIPPEHWIFIALIDTKCDGDYVHATQHNTQWLLLDPQTLQTLVLPNSLVPGVSIDIHLCSAATDNKLFLPEVNGCSLYNLPGQRCTRFALAEVNGFIYLSGRLLDLTREASRNPFRYDTRANQWEDLPNMIMPRINCAGVAMYGKFFAIGGYYHSSGGYMEAHFSGECFIPRPVNGHCPDLCRNGLRYAKNSDATEAVYAV